MSHVEIAKAFVGAVNSRRHPAGLNPQGSNKPGFTRCQVDRVSEGTQCIPGLQRHGVSSDPSPSGHNHQLGCEQGRVLQGAKWQEKCGTRME